MKYVGSGMEAFASGLTPVMELLEISSMISRLVTLLLFL